MMESESDSVALAHVLMADYPDQAYQVVNRMRAIALDYLDMESFGFWGKVLAIMVANDFQMDTSWHRSN